MPIIFVYFFKIFCIDKTFYQNEQDALEYYAKKMTRKREIGGKYNDKFFDDEVLDSIQLEESDIIW